MKSKGSGTEGWAVGVLVGLRFSFLCLASTSAQAIKGPAKMNLTVRLRVYDYARVAPDDLARAKGEATRVLLVAGVKTVWHECVMTAAGLQGELCRGRVGSGALVLRILPRSMAEHLPFGKATFGFTPVSKDGRRVDLANISYYRVERLAVDQRFERGMILGYVMAHEIGHLLLGPHSHAANGIMKVPWKRQDLIDARWQRLFFLPQQAKRMRAEIKGRMLLERVASNPVFVAGN